VQAGGRQTQPLLLSAADLALGCEIRTVGTAARGSEARHRQAAAHAGSGAAPALLAARFGAQRRQARSCERLAPPRAPSPQPAQAAAPQRHRSTISLSARSDVA